MLFSFLSHYFGESLESDQLPPEASSATKLPPPPSPPHIPSDNERTRSVVAVGKGKGDDDGEDEEEEEEEEDDDEKKDLMAAMEKEEDGVDLEVVPESECFPDADEGPDTHLFEAITLDVRDEMPTEMTCHEVVTDDPEMVNYKKGNFAVEEHFPIEMQCEVVDMNDPKMDPLEWAVRMVVPIPKAYFWETGNIDLPTRTKVWHRTVCALGMGVRLAENIGWAFASVVGLNADDEIEYVLSTMSKEEWATARTVSEERRAQRQHHVFGLS